jgi:hypothetical protein
MSLKGKEETKFKSGKFKETSLLFSLRLSLLECYIPFLGLCVGASLGARSTV